MRDRARRVQIALEAARMGAWELDVLGSGRPPVTDLELMRSLDTGRVSPPMEQMMRLDPGGFHSHRELERHLHPDDRAATLEALRAAIEGDRPYDIEHRYLWPDGSIHWIHCRGMLFRDGEGAKQRLMGVSTDVTARKQAEL